jgi:hypothetical protein
MIALDQAGYFESKLYHKKAKRHKKAAEDFVKKLDNKSINITVDDRQNE